jgi:hypothetical protein
MRRTTIYIEDTTRFINMTIRLKHTHKTKDRVTQILLETTGELMCSERISSSFSPSGTRRVNLARNPVISHE